MDERENLPTVIASQAVAALTEKRGSLVARGLAAVRDRENQSLSLTIEADAEKLFRQGMRYRYGEGGTPEDDDKAHEYLLAAAKLNHAEAQYELSILFRECSYGSDAEQWLKCAARLGFGPAQYQYATNFKLPNDEHNELIKNAFAWHEERAQAGDAKRQYDLAQMHFEREMQTADRNEGMRWLKASAAQDYRFACLQLGQKYLHDKITEHTTQQGIYWLSHAADLGVARACKSLGDLYLLGHRGSRYDARNGLSFPQRITPDKKAAVAWYERGIELGGRGGCRLEWGLRQFQREMDSGGQHAYDLGQLYLLGEFLEQNFGLAEKWLLHAATAGHGSAQALLGSEYASGKRFKQDADAAIHWLALAAEHSQSAGLKLAEIYLDGEITSRSFKDGIKWLTHVANIIPFIIW